MPIINLVNMKINEVETLSSVTIGRSVMQGVKSIGVKNNQSFGQEASDGTLHVRSVGTINDSDLVDKTSRHDRAYYLNPHHE